MSRVGGTISIDKPFMSICFFKVAGLQKIGVDEGKSNFSVA